MKRILLVASVLVVCSCVGKMKTMGLSETEIHFPPEASEHMVHASKSRIVLEVMTEGNASKGILPTEKQTKIKGKWATVTKTDEHTLLIQVSENNSGHTREAAITMWGDSAAGRIDIYQESK